MKKVNLMSRAEMKNVLGGSAPIGGGGDLCRFKYKYSENGSWTGWSEAILTSDPAGDCVRWIGAGTNGIVHCGYDCLNS